MKSVLTNLWKNVFVFFQNSSNFRRYDLFFVINRDFRVDADTKMFCFYAKSIASFKFVTTIWIIIDLNWNLSSIESNDFHNSLFLFCSWNAFFKRVSIEIFWLHYRHIIETRSIRCLDDYWHRTSRKDLISSFYRSQIFIIKRDTQCKLTERTLFALSNAHCLNNISNDRHFRSVNSVHRFQNVSRDRRKVVEAKSIQFKRIWNLARLFFVSITCYYFFEFDSKDVDKLWSYR